MPMRSALVLPVSRDEVQDHDHNTNCWLVIGFCLIGLIASLCFLLAGQSFGDVPLLIAQYNFG